MNTGVEAQLNFSTGWGKRSQRIGVVEWGVRTECATQAKPTVEQLLSVYHLIQVCVSQLVPYILNRSNEKKEQLLTKSGLYCIYFTDRSAKNVGLSEIERMNLRVIRLILEETS